MRRRLRSNNLIKLAMIGVVAMAGGFLITSLCGSKSSTQALSATEFQAGRIIDDSIFYNPNTMTAAEIDAFIDSHSPACDMWGTQTVYGNVTRAEYVKQLRAQGNSKYHDPPFVCVSEYYENPETHKTNFSTGGKKEEGMLSAGEIIYKAAHEYNINPQVLLVMLKKESYVWGDDWPHDFQYNTVMGYACPDGAPCDSKYFGFYNQVMMAAWQLNYYRDHIYSYNYRPYATNNILYNPDRSCGSKSVYLENIATTSLYIYTPYVPNDGALANYPGTSWCGSYGNRNFYMYFREWFGSTLDEGYSAADFYPEEYIITDNSYTSSIQANESESNILFAPRNALQNERFVFEKDNNNTYTIKQSNSDYYLSVPNSELNSEVSLQTLSNNYIQKWVILDFNDGSYALSPYSGKNLAVSISADKKPTLTYLSRSDRTQHFIFVQTIQPIEDGLYEIYSKKNSAFAIDISDGKQNVSGTNIQLYSVNHTPAQQFYLTYNQALGTYTIESKIRNYALDVDSNKKNSGTNIQLYALNGSSAQQWEIHKNSNESYTFLGRGSGKALDLASGEIAIGSNIQIFALNYSLAQQWILNPVEKPSEQKTNEQKTSDTQSQSPTSSVIEPGRYEILSSINPYFAVDVYDNASYNTANIQLYYRNYTAAQSFEIRYNESTNDYTLFTSHGKTIDVNNRETTNGTNIWQYESNGTCAQRWQIRKNSDDTVTFLSTCSPNMTIDLDNANASSGTNIQLYSDNGTLAQKWILVNK